MGTGVIVEEETRAVSGTADRTAIILGAAAGALVGGMLVWAYRRALIRQAEERGEVRPAAAIGLPDIARVALAALGLLRQVAELGQ
jgi:hypothetical protein